MVTANAYSVCSYYRVEAGKEDLKEFTDNKQEYEEIVTWITILEERLRDMKDDQSGDDDSLRQRQIIITVRFETTE